MEVLSNFDFCQFWEWAEKTENRAKEYNFMIAGFYILDFLSSLVMKKHIAKWSD